MLDLQGSQCSCQAVGSVWWHLLSQQWHCPFSHGSQSKGSIWIDLLVNPMGLSQSGHSELPLGAPLGQDYLLKSSGLGFSVLNPCPTQDLQGLEARLGLKYPLGIQDGIPQPSEGS